MSLHSPKLIGHGSYGYIHFPALKIQCDHDNVIETFEISNKKDMDNVSKLLIKSEAEEEYEKYRIMQTIDSSAVFHLGMPIMATPHASSAPHISSCTKKGFLDVCKNIDDWRILIMPHGGVHIGKYANYLYKNGKPDSDKHREKASKLWVELFRIFHGIHQLNENGFVHHDVNFQNVLYDEENNRCNLIDMNFLTQINELKKTANNPSGYHLAIFHFNLPPELVFYRQEDFDKLQNFSYDECDEFFKKIYLSKTFFGLDKNPINVSGNIIDTEKYDEYLNNLFYMIDSDEELLNAFDEIYRAYKTRILFGVDAVVEQVRSALDSTDLLEFEKSELPLREYMISQFRDFIFSDVNVYSYEVFLNDSIQTIDVFGLGGALLYVLLRTYHLLEHEFAMEMYDLIRRMMDTNVRTRYSIQDCIETYFMLIDKYFEL